MRCLRVHEADDHEAAVVEFLAEGADGGSDAVGAGEDGAEEEGGLGGPALEGGEFWGEVVLDPGCFGVGCAGGRFVDAPGVDLADLRIAEPEVGVVAQTGFDLWAFTGEDGEEDGEATVLALGFVWAVEENHFVGGGA